MKETEQFIEIELSKKDLDELIEYLDSNNFRNYGFGHFLLENGKLLLITCKQLVKNREKYEKLLIKSKLKPEEIIEHLNHQDKNKS